MQTVVLDIDNVVLRWNSQLIPFLKFKGIEKLEILEKIARNEFIDLRIEFSHDFMDEYHNSSYCANLLPLEDINIEIIFKLKQYYNVIALTSFSEHGGAQKNRNENIVKYYPDVFSEVIILPSFSPKKEALKIIKEKYNIAYFVDDSMKHIEESVEILGADKTVWFNEGKTDLEINQVKNWNELENLLINSLKPTAKKF